MIEIKSFVNTLKNSGVEFIAGVPDTLLNDFCLFVETEWPQEKHFIAANEGNAIALAAGYHLATDSIPLVYMQNSGIGNALNPLISLTHQSVCGIPMVLLIGWRGEPLVKDHPQHLKQGELTPILMDDLDIPWKVLNEDTHDAIQKVEWAISNAKSSNRPTALFVTKSVLEKGEKAGFEDVPDLLNREETMRCVIENLPSSTVYVASTGRTTRELYEIRRLRNEEHNHDFLNVGAMGHTSSIAAGIAIANKKNLVVCFDGDASSIMHMGAMGVIAQKEGLKNFIHIVLNNGVHESVGGQKAISEKISLRNVAKDLGYHVFNDHVSSSNTLITQLELALKSLHRPVFIEVKIKKGIRKDMPKLVIDPREMKISFQRTLKI